MIIGKISFFGADLKDRRAIQMLDKTFSIDKNHTSAEYEIKVVNFKLAEV